ncbi:MAG: thioredoxin domain-containing protein, partial [Cyanobacteria bacterium J06639_14]
VVKYGDYQCPRCQQAHGEIQSFRDRLAVIEPKLHASLCFVFRHFPVVPLHPFAQYAAEVAEAAGAQGQFWAMHDYLFEHPLEQGNGALFAFANRLNLDVHRFEQEVAEHTYLSHIQKDVASGIQSDVNGTPTFFINGHRYDGDSSPQGLWHAIKYASR